VSILRAVMFAEFMADQKAANVTAQGIRIN
jgi:hypothetical protein